LCFCRYAPLDSCLFTTAITTLDERYNWPVPWPERLDVRYASVPDDSASNKEKFEADTKYWKQLVSEVYFSDFPLNWSSIRNVMDMNACFGGYVKTNFYCYFSYIVFFLKDPVARLNINKEELHRTSASSASSHTADCCGGLEAAEVNYSLNVGTTLRILRPYLSIVSYIWSTRDYKQIM
jgi:hypothetical protein